MLPLPDTEELDEFSHDETAQFSDDQKELALQQAGDLLFIATEYDETPDDLRLIRIIKYGLMDMAWSLLVQTENKSEIFSPFSSERIGSYSYSKALSRIANGQDSGVAWFDRLLGYLGTLGLVATSAISWGSAESVFTQPYDEALGPYITDAYMRDYFGM